VTEHETLRQHIAAIVEQSSEGSVSKAAALTPGATLTDTGLTSLSYLRLIDKIENDIGVYIDLEGDTSFLGSVDSIAEYIDAQRSADQ
jgi:acyl carrier protein